VRPLKETIPLSRYPCKPVASRHSAPWKLTQGKYLPRRRGEDADPLKHTRTEAVTFSPLPCWKHLAPEAYRERVAKLGLEIEEEAAAKRRRTGAEPFGAAKILAQAPSTRPERVKKSPPPAPPRGEQGGASGLLRGASPCSSPPIVRPPTSSRGEIPSRASRWAASRRRCRSWVGRPEMAGQERLCGLLRA